MRALPCVFLTFFLFMAGSPALAADSRVDCGDYNFELPSGFELRELELNNPTFGRVITLNAPFNPKELANATATCVREKKTAYESFALPHKENINFLMAARRATPLHISATENAVRDNLRFKFSLLEERTTNAREIKGLEHFMVAIEMDASSDEWHTMIFVSDFRSRRGFVNVDEFKSQVTGTAIQILDSIKKKTQ